MSWFRRCVQKQVLKPRAVRIDTFAAQRLPLGATSAVFGQFRYQDFVALGLEQQAEAVAADPKLLLWLPYTVQLGVFNECGWNLWRYVYDGVYPYHLHTWLQLFPPKQFTVLPRGKLQALDVGGVLQLIAAAFGLHVDSRVVQLVAQLAEKMGEEGNGAGANGARAVLRAGDVPSVQEEQAEGKGDIGEKFMSVSPRGLEYGRDGGFRIGQR